MSHDQEFEKLAADYVEGTLDADGRRRLEELTAEASSVSGLADQLRTHHQLKLLGDREGGSALPGRVVRELKLEGDADRFSKDVVGRLKTGRRRFLRAAGGAVAAGIAIFFGVVLLILRPDDPQEGTVPAGARGDALLVVDRSEAREADARVAEALSRAGFTVHRRGFQDLGPRDFDGMALIAVSSSSTVRQALEGKRETIELLRDAPVPLLTWEPMLFAGLGMTAGEVHKTDWAAERHQTRIAIRDPAHPLAAGLSGDVAVSRQPLQVSWGRPAGEVSSVAVLAGDPSRSVIFGYEAGASMGRGNAPARRVGFFFFNEGPMFVTDDGWRLLRAAVLWCAEGRVR